MGIPKGTARLLLDEHRERPFSGSVLQFGRSSVYFTWDELQRWARMHRVTLSAVDEVRLSHDPRLAKQGCIDDKTLFTALGFDEVHACDISDWEEPEHVLDLNDPIPEALHGRYDVVLDPGSSLQIFHQPNLLANIHHLLRDGGRIVHAGVPSNNHMDLGFYMFSPTFFHDFYSANRWRIDCEYLCQYFPYWHRGRFYSAPWKIYEYSSGSLDHLNYGRFGGKQCAVFMVATKTPEATGDKVPQLGQYVHSWQVYDEHREAAGDEAPDLAAGQLPDEAPGGVRAGLEATAEKLFDAVPLVNRLYLPVKRGKEWLKRRLPKRMPPLVARY